MFCSPSTGLANELDVGVGGRGEPMVIPKLRFEKLVENGTCKTKREGSLWKEEKLRVPFQSS